RWRPSSARSWRSPPRSARAYRWSRRAAPRATRSCRSSRRSWSPAVPVELRGDDLPDRSPSMAWQTVDGELVLLHVDGRELLGLNAVGALVWELADGAHSVDAIAVEVSRAFEVDRAQAEADVRQFVADLVGMGALVLGPR